jgi:hypothetical protein
MKVALYVLFLLAVLTGTVALLTIPMRALANDDVVPVGD